MGVGVAFEVFRGRSKREGGQGVEALYLIKP